MSHACRSDVEAAAMSPSRQEDRASGVRGRRRKKRRADGGVRSPTVLRRQRARSRGHRRPAGSRRRRQASWRGPVGPRVQQGASDRCGRGVDVALRKPKQRQARLWFSSALVRARVRRFGLCELTPKSMDLAEPVERRTRRRPGHQQLTRVLRILRGIIPFAKPLHDFGAIEEALAAITHEAGLSWHTIARAKSSTRRRDGDRRSPDRPPAHCSRCHPPGMGATSPAMTATIASSSRATPSAILSEADERPAASVTGKRRQVAIAKTVGDPGGLAECRVTGRRGRLARCAEWRRESAGYPRRTQSSWASSRIRSALENQPDAGALAPRCSRPNASQAAERAAPSQSPRVQERLMRASSEAPRSRHPVP